MREGDKTGLKVTLRGERMYEFMDRLINLAIPRVKDFRGLNPKRFRRPRQLFDGPGRAERVPGDRSGQDRDQQGMNITFVTTAETDDEAREMLRLFGMPFRASRKL